MSWIKELIDYLSKSLSLWVTVQPWEEGVRVRIGKYTKSLTKGIYLRIPLLDSVYIQTTRLRVFSCSPQTLTSKDNNTITITAAIGYSITSIDKLYSKLHHPQSTISNIVKGAISDYISKSDIKECSPESLSNYIEKQIELNDYGIKYEYVKIIGYAVVRTYRLIQDQHWEDNSMDMDEKRI
jgi:regulator of protease activity HflC (stomatin/prohibitin superfamily)